MFPLIFYLTHTSLRYRFPMDPIMMVLAAYGVAYLVSLLRRRTSHVRGSVTPQRRSRRPESASRPANECCISWSNAGRTGNSF